ncbi:phage tail spike protein [[Clostridium] innocuum]|uniref:phage tail spike protein n=1 Tax=Clostridium innocuum TaxID=1522 RepID=UPI0032D52AA7
MKLFKVYVDGQIFYHPNLSKLAITQAVVSEDAENIDSFTLSAPFNHPYIDSIKPMASVIQCKKDDEVVFEGRALDDGSDFYNTHTWTCESALAYLKDTLQPPFSYKGGLRGLLEYFVSVHNSSVEERKKFVIGNVTVTDDNDYVSYSNSDYSVTLDAIKSKLINTYGGYLAVRYEEDGNYLDYLSDFKTKSMQTVEYGKNITDVKIKRDDTEKATALIPLGAKKTVTDEEGTESETSERVDITSVNDEKNYICDEDAVREIGWIWKTEIWEDVTLPGNLLRKGRTRLMELVQGITSMELTIIDESDTGADIGDIHAGMYVECISKPHGINGTYLCINRTRDYLKPSGNTITIGASGITLTASTVKQDKTIESLGEDILAQTEKIEVIDAKAEDASKTADLVKEQVHECYTEIAKTSDEIISIVHDTYLEKSELEQLQQDFQSSITQNSSEIRMDFTQITDEIKGNIAYNQELLEEYIRFRGALIELGKVGNAFTAELSNDQLAFKENGQTIAYISNQSLVITNAEIRNKLSLGNESRGWFDFIPRTNGNLSIKWRDPSV